MTQPPLPPVHDDLVFFGPLSEQRAGSLIRSLGPLDGQHVVDLGCGWAEFLLRALATAPTATGLGIDRNDEAIEHARCNARSRGLADRVELSVGDAGEWSGEADVLIVNGASQVWGGEDTTHTVNALTNAKKLLRSGGRLLLGEGFWEHRPSADQLRETEIPLEQYRPLAGLVDLAVEHGFRPLSVSVASTDEWDEFESGFARGWERWLLANPDSPDYADVLARADGHRRARLHGWRGVLGLAYLTLGLP